MDLKAILQLLCKEQWEQVDLKAIAQLLCKEQWEQVDLKVILQLLCKVPLSSIAHPQSGLQVDHGFLLYLKLSLRLELFLHLFPSQFLKPPLPLQPDVR